MEINRWPNPPCNCRFCRVCEMAGIAYPLARRPPVEPAGENFREAKKVSVTPATLFDQLESENRE